MSKNRRYWLVKSEPDTFSFDDLLASPKQTTSWEGVRNYQARNFMREMRTGDRVIFYHSSTTPPGVAGLAEVVREACPDPTQFNPASTYYDPKAGLDAPRWDTVEIRAHKKFAKLLPLERLRQEPALAGLHLLKRGSRLSVMPLTEEEYRRILELADQR